MVRNSKKPKKISRQIILRVLKAAAKGILVYLLYFIIWTIFLAPLAFLAPNLQEIIETFLLVYIVLMVIGEFTSGTIFQHFFEATRALFVIGYLLFSLKGGVVSLTYQEISLTINLSLFLMFAILLSLLGLTKSVLQAINYLAHKVDDNSLNFKM